jgi:2-methylisocitrate lyase-like PEP mutase family enzyme
VALDLGDTIKRLQAYQAAGADVPYASGIVGKDDIATIVKSADRPVNVVMPA